MADRIFSVPSKLLTIDTSSDEGGNTGGTGSGRSPYYGRAAADDAVSMGYAASVNEVNDNGAATYEAVRQRE